MYGNTQCFPLKDTKLTGYMTDMTDPIVLNPLRECLVSRKRNPFHPQRSGTKRAIWAEYLNVGVFFYDKTHFYQRT